MELNGKMVCLWKWLALATTGCLGVGENDGYFFFIYNSRINRWTIRKAKKS